MVQGIPQITGKVAQIVQPVITALNSFVSDFVAAGEEMVRGICRAFKICRAGWKAACVR